MAGFPWAAVAKAGSEIAGSMLGGAMNYHYQKKLMNYQFQLQNQMLDKVNEYNSPRNQVRRLVSGGLNPNLAYGSVNSVSGSSTPSISGGSMSVQTPKIDLAQGLLLHQQIRAQKAEADLTEQRAKGESLENERREAEKPYWENNASFKSDTLKWLNMSSENRAKNDEINYQVNKIIQDAQMGGTHSYPDLNIDDSRDTPLYRATVDKLTREGLRNDEIDTRIEKLNKDMQQIDAHIRLMKKQGLNIDMRTELLKLEKSMKETLGVSYSDSLGWRLLSRFLGYYDLSPEKIASLVNSTGGEKSAVLGLPYTIYNWFKNPNK